MKLLEAIKELDKLNETKDGEWNNELWDKQAELKDEIRSQIGSLGWEEQEEFNEEFKDIRSDVRKHNHLDGKVVIEY